MSSVPIPQELLDSLLWLFAFYVIWKYLSIAYVKRWIPFKYFIKHGDFSLEDVGVPDELADRLIAPNSFKTWMPVVISKKTQKGSIYLQDQEDKPYNGFHFTGHKQNCYLVEPHSHLWISYFDINTGMEYIPPELDWHPENKRLLEKKLLWYQKQLDVERREKENLQTINSEQLDKLAVLNDRISTLMKKTLVLGNRGGGSGRSSEGELND